MNTDQNVLGNYVGICHNRTANLSANLVLLLHGSADQRVHGELGLYGDLAGGGAFHGTLAAGSLSFTTCEPGLQLVIEWQGHIRGTELKGAYEVFCDHPEAPAHGLQHQYGEWGCRLARRLGPPNSSRMHLVSVFDQGRSEGPFILDDFVRHVRAGRWPMSAVVALDDMMTWWSLAELLSFIESQGQPVQPPTPSFASEVARETGKKVIAGALAALVLAAFGISSD